jgi:opacity protein-like surface antigen
MLSILLAAALSGMWDDETFLGRGPMAGAGVSVAVSRHLSVEGELDWASLHRDSGYLAADGTPITATGRLSFAFRDRSKNVRPFVSAGLGWIRSTGHLTHTNLAAGPIGQPVVQSTQRTDWKNSLGAWELGTGVEIQVSARWAIRPEVRWTATASDPTFGPGTLEPPLWLPRAGVALTWTPRK